MLYFNLSYLFMLKQIQFDVRRWWWCNKVILSKSIFCVDYYHIQYHFAMKWFFKIICFYLSMSCAETSVSPSPGKGSSMACSPSTVGGGSSCSSGIYNRQVGNRFGMSAYSVIVSKHHHLKGYSSKWEIHSSYLHLYNILVVHNNFAKISLISDVKDLAYVIRIGA